jgi:hypothetical protein
MALALLPYMANLIQHVTVTATELEAAVARSAFDPVLGQPMIRR